MALSLEILSAREFINPGGGSWVAFRESLAIPFQSDLRIGRAAVAGGEAISEFKINPGGVANLRGLAGSVEQSQGTNKVKPFDMHPVTRTP